MDSLSGALIHGRARAIQMHIAKGADVKGADAQGAPLVVYLFDWYCAGLTEKSRNDCLRRFLAAGADPNAVDPKTGDSLLLLAARKGEVQAVRTLVAAGADVRRENKHGQTALDLATQCGSLETQRFLEEARCPRSKEPSLAEAARSGDLERVRHFLAAGVPTGERDQCLRVAAYCGHGEVFQALVRAGAMVRAKSPEGTNLLHEAACGGNVDIVRSLLQAGLDPNSRAQDQGTPLMSAARNGHVEAARVLLEAGADVRAKTDKGYTALKWACMAGQAKRAMIELLRSAGAEVDPTFAVVRGFRQAGEDPAFQREVARLTEVLGQPPKPWPKRKGVILFYARQLADLARRHAPNPGAWAEDDEDSRAWAFLVRLQAETRAAGFQLIHAGTGPVGSFAKLLLFPTRDKYAVIKTFGTSAGNYHLDNDYIIAWLRHMEEQNPFALTECAFDLLSGEFLQPVPNAKELAQSMYEFCPDIVGQGLGTIEALAVELERAQAFSCWWD